MKTKTAKPKAGKMGRPKSTPNLAPGVRTTGARFDALPNVRAERINAGLTLGEAAEILGKGAAHLQKIETGTVSIRGPEALPLAEALGLTLENFFSPDRVAADPVRKVCNCCGSENIRVDASAKWDAVNQCWTVAEVSDDCATCDDCGRDVVANDAPRVVADQLPENKRGGRPRKLSAADADMI